MEPHCPEYEHLTMEEKLLVNVEMKKWYKNIALRELIIPIYIFKVVEERVIKSLKRKETNDRRNRKQSAGRRDNK